MPIFGAIGIASTGATVYRKWLDAVSDNIANMNNATDTSSAAFQAHYIQVRAVDYGSGTGGVEVAAALRSGNTQGRVVHEPDNPLADADGNVRYPDIDLGEQMTSLIMAQRGYQANLSVVDRARDAYNAALQLGRS